LAPIISLMRIVMILTGLSAAAVILPVLLVALVHTAGTPLVQTELLRVE
jgi:hypothetical protein